MQLDRNTMRLSQKVEKLTICDSFLQFRYPCSSKHAVRDVCYYSLFAYFLRNKGKSLKTMTMRKRERNPL